MNVSEIIPDHQSYTATVTKILLPNITIALSEAREELGLLSKSLVNMDILVNRSLSERKVYLSIADKLSEDVQKINFNSPSVINQIETVLTFLNPIIVIILLAAVAHLYLKQRNIAAALLLLGALHKPANSAPTTEVPSKVFIPDAWKHKSLASSKTTVEPITFPTFPTINYDKITIAPLETIQIRTSNSFENNITTLFSLLLAIVLTYLGVKILCFIIPKCTYICRCIRKIQNQKTNIDNNFNFKLILSIGNMKETISFDMLTVPFTSNEYEFKADRFLEKVEVIGSLRHQIKITWHDFCLCHRYSKLKLALPENIEITRAQASKVKLILANEYFILIHVKNNDNVFSIAPLQHTIWARADTTLQVINEASVSAVSSNPPKYTRKKLYPKLGPLAP